MAWVIALMPRGVWCPIAPRRRKQQWMDDCLSLVQRSEAALLDVGSDLQLHEMSYLVAI